MVRVLNTKVVSAMVSHLYHSLTPMIECCGSMHTTFHRLTSIYHGSPVVSWANLSTVCIYLLKNQTSSRAASQPSSSTPATALSIALGPKSESLVAAASTKSVVLLDACVSSPLLKDLA